MFVGAASDLGDFAGAGEGEFVEAVLDPVGAMDDEGATCAEVAMAAATRATRLGAKTPMTWARAPAGLVRGRRD